MKATRSVLGTEPSRGSPKALTAQPSPYCQLKKKCSDIKYQDVKTLAFSAFLNMDTSKYHPHQMWKPSNRTACASLSFLADDTPLPLILSSIALKCTCFEVSLNEITINVNMCLIFFFSQQSKRQVDGWISNLLLSFFTPLGDYTKTY